MRILLALFLFAGFALAQPVTITGTLTGPGGDLLNGSCVFTSSTSFQASDGNQVVPSVPMTVSFTTGNLSVALEPNDTSIPSNGYYTVNCTAPRQTVTGLDGKSHMSQGSWGPWNLIVRAAPYPSTLNAALIQDPPTAVTVPWQQITFAGLPNGCFSLQNGKASSFNCGILTTRLTWTQQNVYSWSQM